ncbi:MAG: hypothetical protein Q9216_003647 [Gyalolechia sp. 2 TL-2023]
MDLSPASQVPARMPSPTLTNPDMILPDPHSDRNAASPPRPHDSSALPQWQPAPDKDDGQMKAAVRNLFGNGQSLRHRNSEKALKSQGTSEIRPQSKQSELSQSSSAFASSPLLHERFAINSMGTTLPGDSTNENLDASLDTVDDGSVISESISPLVDAERQEYLMSENGGIDGYKFSDRFRKAIVEEDEEAYSHATMSIRAEEILANAKKRLTEMESNLNRARHTINRPSSSMSSFLTSSSDPPSMYTLPKTLSPSKHRQHTSPPTNSMGHSRVFSETSIPSSMQTLPPHGEVRTNDVRSSSAMGLTEGAAPAGASTKQGSESRDWFWAGLTRNTNHGIRHNNYGLQPLNEDGPPPSTFESPERQQSPPVMDSDPEVVPSNQEQSDPSPSERSSTSSNGLTRARSTNQMRDIRDQMQDLKGKISSLKQRAREDSLRRRSLQSLRTPSPFTAAEQWYTGTSGYKRDRSRSKPREGSPPAIQPAIEEEDETKQYPVQEPIPETESNLGLTTIDSSSRGSGVSQEHIPLHDATIKRDSGSSPKTVIDAPTSEAIEAAGQARPEESQALNQSEGEQEGRPEDSDDDLLDNSSALPIGGRHEDRPDAFDYEHLFLHSGMGTLGREGKSRSSSHSSMYSVETTKPSNVTTEPSEVSSDDNVSLVESGAEDDLSGSQRIAHERKGSVESVSTVATFATATEGEGLDEDADEEEWVYRRPMAGSWEPEVPSHRKVTAGGKEPPQQISKGIKHTAIPNASPSMPTTNGTENGQSYAESPTTRQASEERAIDLLAFLTSKLAPKDGTAAQAIELNNSDKDLAERLVRSVAQKYSVDDSIDSWALFDRTFPSTAKNSPIMSRRVFDVGLDVGRIKNGLKFHSSDRHERTRNHRSASTSDARPKILSDNDRQLAVTPRLKGKRSSPSLRPDQSKTVHQLSSEPVTLPPISSPTNNDPLPPPEHKAIMNGDDHAQDDHMEPLHTPSDDGNNFDLKPPPPKRPARFLETYSEQIFSDAHLHTILRDPGFSLRFTAFLNRYKPQFAPILSRYLEAQKAIKAVEYANALAETFKPIPGDSLSQIPCVAATLDSRFELRSRRAMEALVHEALPAYITQCFTKVVTEWMVREITGTTMPIMRELVGGLAEVFCLSDPSIKDNPIVYASEEFYRTTQYGRDYVIGRNCRFLQGPKTDRNAVARIREAVRTGQESFETILNYRRDGSPFMNLIMTAPLYDNKGTVKYFLGAQVDISGLVEEGRGLDSFERYLAESRRNRDSIQSFMNQKHTRALSELGQSLSAEESTVLHGQGYSREGSVHDSEYGGLKSIRGIQGRRDPSSRPIRRVLGNEDDEDQEKEKNAWALNSLGPSGKLPGVYQNYFLLRPHPSLRIIFVSPALRIPGLLQSPFLSRIGGPAHVRSGLSNAFANGEDITAKVTWLPQGRSDDDTSSSLASRPGSRHDQHNTNEGCAGSGGSRTRYISCTPLIGSDDKVGVWIVVMVENETVTGSLPSRTHAITRYGSTYTNQNHEIPPTPSEYEREVRDSQDTSNEQRFRSPAPSWRGNTKSTPSNNPNPRAVNGNAERERERDSGKVYADFMRNQRSSHSGRGGPHNVHRNLFMEANVNGNVNAQVAAVATPPAGTGRVIGGATDDVGLEDGILEGVGDGGGKGVKVMG